MARFVCRGMISLCWVSLPGILISLEIFFEVQSRGVLHTMPYRDLYGKAPPERGIFFRLQVYERGGISLVEVYKRVGKSVIWVCERAQKG